MNRARVMILLVLLSKLLFASQQTLWMHWDDGLKTAKETQKMMMIKVVRNGCHYCSMMQKNVFDKKDVQRFIQKNFVPVSINISEEKMPLGFRVTMTPSFYFITADEKLFKRIPGAWEKDAFMDMMNEILLEELP